jgi:hypothetical protein
MASNQQIEENCNRLVELDKRLRSLLGARDGQGLLILAQEAEAVKQTSIARRALVAAYEVAGAPNG